MNKIFKIKWNAATQSYMVCSELARRAGKAVVGGSIALATISTPVYADETCGDYTNDVIIAGLTCTEHVADGVNNVGRLGGVILVGNASTVNRNYYAKNKDIVLGSGSDRFKYSNGGYGNSILAYGWDSTTPRRSTLSAHNIALYLDGSSAGTNSYGGAGASYGGAVALNNFSIDVINANNGDFNGVMAGVSYADKNPNGENLKNYVHIYGDYNFTAKKANMSNSKPTTGIRAISNNNGRGTLATFFQIDGEYGPENIVTIDGTYTANITGGYANGVYVSGKWDDRAHMPTVNLNHTNITLNGSGNALKIGKSDRGFPNSNRDGWGAGTLNFKENAEVVIDQSNAKGEAIAIVYDNSVLNAEKTLKFNVISQGNVIRVGNDILTNSGQASSKLISAKINNAQFKQTSNNTNDMFSIDPEQGNVQFDFTGDDTSMIAADKGWLINVQRRSNLTFNAKDKGLMTGLSQINNTSSLNINLDNNFTWNLREHTNAAGEAVKLATFSTLNLANGATLDAVKEKTDAISDFTTKGNINSTEGVINLANERVKDKLTIEGNYNGTKGKLNLDTKLGDDSSETDVLIIDGDTAGTTAIQVNNINGIGNFTKTGIKIVDILNGVSDGVFSLIGDGITSSDSLTVGADNKHKFVYRLYKGEENHTVTGNNAIPEDVDTTDIDAKDWYLRSTCGSGSHSVGNAFATSQNDGLGCITDDQITITEGANIVKVEGAGGADTILINSNAKVADTVFGGEPGVDNSAEQDKGDKITVTDKAEVAGNINGQQGDDTISVTTDAKVKGNLLGEEGDDTFEWSGHSTIAGLNGHNGSDTATVSSTKYDGSQKLDGGDDTEIADGFIDTLNLNGVTVTANGGNIANWEVVKLASNTNLTLEGALATGSGKNNDGNTQGLHIDNSSKLAVATDVTVSGDVHNNGTVDLTQTTTGQTLTIEGDYTAIDGKLNIGTTLGDDSSATDRLFVTGNTSGNTVISVNNINGKGAFAPKGIKVVQVDGDSAANSFTLENENITLAEPNKHSFIYRLYQGITGVQGDTTGIDTNDWYLRSTCGGGSHSVGSAFATSQYDGLGCITDD